MHERRRRVGEMNGLAGVRDQQRAVPVLREAEWSERSRSWNCAIV
jgi:hypothetical protein